MKTNGASSIVGRRIVKLRNMGRRHNKNQPTTLHRVLVALAALVLMSACTGTNSSALSEPPTPVGTESIRIATITPLMVTPGITPTLTVPSLATTDTALTTTTPARDLSLTPVPLPVGPLAALSLPLPQDDATTWYLPGSPEIVAMRDTIVTVFRTNELEFDLGYPVQGFTPGEVWLDGRPLTWDTFTVGQDTYLTATLPTGRHSLVVESRD